MDELYPDPETLDPDPDTLDPDPLLRPLPVPDPELPSLKTFVVVVVSLRPYSLEPLAPEDPEASLDPDPLLDPETFDDPTPEVV